MTTSCFLQPSPAEALPWPRLVPAFHFWLTVGGTGAALATAPSSCEEKEVGEKEGASLSNLLPRAGSFGLGLGTAAEHGSVLSAGRPEITQTRSLPSN